MANSSRVTSVLLRTSYGSRTSELSRRKLAIVHSLAPVPDGGWIVCGPDRLQVHKCEFIAIPNLNLHHSMLLSDPNKHIVNPLAKQLHIILT